MHTYDSKLAFEVCRFEVSSIFFYLRNEIHTDKRIFRNSSEKSGKRISWWICDSDKKNFNNLKFCQIKQHVHKITLCCRSWVSILLFYWVLKLSVHYKHFGNRKCNILSSIQILLYFMRIFFLLWFQLYFIFILLVDISFMFVRDHSWRLGAIQIICRITVQCL